jgi:hypothetical protein
MEHKTVMTVLSKPIPRPLFVLSKFLGVSAAVIIGHFICTAALLMAIRHGVMESAADEYDWTVIISGVLSLGTSVLLATFFSYAYEWKFSSTVVVMLALTLGLSLLFLAFVDSHWAFHPAENGMSAVDIMGALLLLLAALVIAALALALSARFNIVVTLSACMGIFLLGLVSDYAFGRFADTYFLARLGRYLVPNLQLFWISDAIYEGSTVPMKYVGMAATYAICYIGAVLAVAIAMFQRRQVG